MNEQAHGLATLATQLDERLDGLGAPLALVTGGKGGVGKSSVALNLAIALGRRGRRVLLVDLDLGLGDLAVMMKLSPSRTLENFFAGDAELASCRTPLAGGVDLIPGGAGSGDLARPDSARRAQLFAALAQLAPDYDLVLADSAAGIGPNVLAFAAAASCVLCVATPDPASITDAYGIVKALDQHAATAGIDLPTPALVLNRVAGASEAESLATRLAKVTQRFLLRRPRLVGWLPESQSVREATRGQRAFVTSAPRALSAQCTVRLAARLESLLALPPCANSL
jgi:flagellar biosynthesis protein FlhG